MEKKTAVYAQNAVAAARLEVRFAQSVVVNVNQKDIFVTNAVKSALDAVVSARIAVQNVATRIC
ncbi:hypothetical protein ACFLY6_02995 [Candidatus Dependentiae bacterium]